ncbi:MAG: hypothetical protein V1871_02860 [Planctomycetota bacterium]
MWQIEKTTKHCQNCVSIIEVGKNYFSALFQNQAPQSEKIPLSTNESRLIRQDFCTNCWEKRTASGEEPPFSFWQTKISTPPEPPKTPRQVLLTFFDNLFIKPEAPIEKAVDGVTDIPKEEQTTVSSKDSATILNITADTKLKSQVKYLFALILLRKRLLKLKESIHKNDKRFLVFERVFDNKIYEIPEISISEQELISLRDEFSKLFEFRI